MNHPRHARLQALEYRDAQPMIARDTSILCVHYTVNDQHYQFPVSNVEWSLDCPALQLLALYGYQPTELNTYTEINQPRFFAATRGGSGKWLPVQGWLSDGRDALKEAKWFDPSLGQESSDINSDASNGGGPDPSTGNRAGVNHETDEEQSGVSTELTPNEDTGVNITVE